MRYCLNQTNQLQQTLKTRVTHVRHQPPLMILKRTTTCLRWTFKFISDPCHHPHNYPHNHHHTQPQIHKPTFTLKRSERRLTSFQLHQNRLYCQTIIVVNRVHISLCNKKEPLRKIFSFHYILFCNNWDPERLGSTRGVVRWV
jgi:hypothetical protein